MDNNTDFALAIRTCSSLKSKFALRDCCFEPAGSRIYIRYATGLSEYLTIPQAVALLG